MYHTIMAVYVYGCENCGHEQEQMHGMREDPTILCPICRTKMHRVPQMTAVRLPTDFNWHQENNGKGKWICGLGRENDPKAYCTSLRQAEEKAKARGMTYEKG